MNHTQIRIKPHYRDQLAKLAASHNRSMANMVEVLIDKEIEAAPTGETVE